MDFSQDFYALLGVSPAADEDQIRAAFHSATETFHPDVNKSAGASLLYQEINRAYEVLNDPVQRRDFDQTFQQRVTAGNSLSLIPYYSRKYLKPTAEPQLLYVLLKVQPATQRKTGGEAPLNICLVVDRSKSMAGIRMQHVKSASHRLIDNCRPGDFISIVAFSDDAEVIIPAQHAQDRHSLKAMVSTLRADGATAMLAGLRQGLGQIQRNKMPEYVNHLVLITDGRTYGDEADCLALAERARLDGVGISCMGIGEDWNDRFLDSLAVQTGGSSGYISSPEAVTKFLESRVRSLSSACAERARLLAAPAPNVKLSEAIRVSPDPMPIPADDQPLALGVIDGQAPTGVMLQFHVATGNLQPGEALIARLNFEAALLGTGLAKEMQVQDLTVTISPESVEEEPPPDLLDGLSKLMLYRLQDRAQTAIAEGDVAQATRSLEYLATRLFEAGEETLGQAALQEAQRVANTQHLSEEGAKHLKYGTRALMPQLGENND